MTGNITLTCENRGLLTHVYNIEQYNKEDINNFECKSVGLDAHSKDFIHNGKHQTHDGHLSEFEYHVNP
jgi:hypothetical protein